VVCTMQGAIQVLGFTLLYFTMCTCALSILRLFSGTYDIQGGDVA